jgi:H+/gluconate symporter-like permease
MCECDVMKICSRCVLGLMMLSVIVAGCLVQPAPTDVEAVSQYNNQIIGLWTPFITPIVTLLGVLALWLKSNWDKRDLAKKTDEAAEKLAETSKVSKEQVIEEVRQQKDLSATALTAANSFNEKILAVQEQVAKQAVRAPSRSTDVDVQKVEITAGPGVDTPLKVEGDGRK